MGRGQAVRGFTILELMVTLVVMAVLLAVAVPAWRGAMRRGNVSSATNALVGDIQYARAEAATRHQYVSICRSISGTGCDVGSADYDAGYIVYAYDASVKGPNQSFGAVSGLTLLRRAVAQPNVSIQATDGNVITFGPTGTPVANGSRTAMTMVVCGRKPGTTTGVGLNDNESVGTRVSMGVSGSVGSTKLAAGAACTAS